MFLTMSLLGCVNLIVFLACHYLLIEYPGSGPEGLGTALVTFGCVFFSMLLGGMGLNRILQESRHGMVKRQSLIATLLAIAPFLLFLLIDVLPYRFKTRH